MFEDVVTYSCDAGYALDGTNSRSCLSTGVWSGDDPTCLFAGRQIFIKCDFKHWLTMGSILETQVELYIQNNSICIYVGHLINSENFLIIGTLIRLAYQNNIVSMVKHVAHIIHYTKFISGQ